MPKFGKVAVLPMILSVVFAAAAGAQGGGATEECSVDENTTVSMSTFALLAAQQPGASASEVTKQLQTAVGRMFPDAKRAAADNLKNPVGRAFVLGKIYMMFLSQEGMPVVTTRRALGFKTDSLGLADLSVGIDSAFKVVEEKMPTCVQHVAQWRQQSGWVRLVQKAMDFANNSQVDSADLLAHQALRISPTAPYSHLVLGNVAAQRSKNDEAIQHYKDALVEASKDTIFSDVRRTIQYTLGNFATDAGQNDTVKANKDKYFAEARVAFEALSSDPGKQYADAARQGLTAVLRAAGDTAAIHRACKDQLAKPDAFNFLTLVQCGVTLAEIEDFSDARKLFDAATTQNPYHRDGLYNLALMQIKADDFDKALKTVDRLIAIDPSNPDNLRLYVHGYNGIRKGQLAKAKAFGDTVNLLGDSLTKLAKVREPVDPVAKKAFVARRDGVASKRKALIDSAAKMDPLQRASLDLLVAWNTKSDSMPVRVTFTEFTVGSAKTTLSGSIENRTATEKSYTINVEFLDKAGTVVGSGKATLEKVRPNGRSGFTVTGTAAGIAGFRYAPLT